jgi:hypothetical protein
MKDIVEASLPEAQRRIYQEDKSVAQLMRRACAEDERESREALLELRSVFYEKKRRLEELQREANAAKALGGDAKAHFWANDPGRELGRLTNLCRSIVALFNDMDLSLHERKTAVRAGAGSTSTTNNSNKHLGRHYTGLGKEE